MAKSCFAAKQDTGPKLDVYKSFIWRLGHHLNALGTCNLDLLRTRNLSKVTKHEPFLFPNISNILKSVEICGNTFKSSYLAQIQDFIWNVKSLCISVRRNFNLICGNVSIYVSTFRSSRPEVFCKKGVLKMFARKCGYQGVMAVLHGTICVIRFVWLLFGFCLID